MLKSYFKIAWRNLVKDKMHSLINITGLSIGMAVALVISLWMYDQLSFNKSFDNYNNISLVYQNLDNNGERQTWTEVPYPLANELRTNYGSDFKHIVNGCALERTYAHDWR
jgi:putative ABC transport system permease protein